MSRRSIASRCGVYGGGVLPAYRRLARLSVDGGSTLSPAVDRLRNSGIGRAHDGGLRRPAVARPDARSLGTARLTGRAPARSHARAGFADLAHRVVRRRAFAAYEIDAARVVLGGKGGRVAQPGLTLGMGDHVALVATNALD